MNEMFNWRVRVYYEDTDAGGVVYHANYLRFMERARSEWLRDIGHPVGQIAKRDHCLFVVREVNMKFLRPAKLDDELIVGARLVATRRTSMQIEQQIWRDNDESGDVLLNAMIQLVTVSSETFRPIALPRFLTQLLKQ